MRSKGRTRARRRTNAPSIRARTNHLRLLKRNAEQCEPESDEELPARAIYLRFEEYLRFVERTTAALRLPALDRGKTGSG